MLQNCFDSAPATDMKVRLERGGPFCFLGLEVAQSGAHVGLITQTVVGSNPGTRNGHVGPSRKRRTFLFLGAKRKCLFRPLSFVPVVRGRSGWIGNIRLFCVPKIVPQRLIKNQRGTILAVTADSVITPPMILARPSNVFTQGHDEGCGPFSHCSSGRRVMPNKL